MVCGFLMKSSLKDMLKVFSRQLPKGSHIFFQTFSISFKDDFIKNPHTAIALPFLKNNILAIVGVHYLSLHPTPPTIKTSSEPQCAIALSVISINMAKMVSWRL